MTDTDTSGTEQSDECKRCGDEFVPGVNGDLVKEGRMEMVETQRVAVDEWEREPQRVVEWVPVCDDCLGRSTGADTEQDQ